MREGLAPLRARKISSQRSAREEAAWRKKKEGRVGHDEEAPARTELAIFLRRRFVTSVICV